MGSFAVVVDDQYLEIKSWCYQLTWTEISGMDGRESSLPILFFVVPFWGIRNPSADFGVIRVTLGSEGFR